MNKKTTTSKTAVKAKTIKSTKNKGLANKAKVKTTKPASKRANAAVSKKKVVVRKGPLHHAKRLYHLTPKFVHGMLVGAVIGLAVVSWVGSTSKASADNASSNPPASDCIKTQGGINKNTADANVDVRLNCGPQRSLVLKVWYAQSSNGQPHNTQRLLVTSAPGTPKASDNGYTHIKVNLPGNFSGCFYQIDLVDMTHPATDNTGNPIVTSITGGSRDCTPVPDYGCTALHAVANANRQVTIDQFNVKATNATFSRAIVDWGDGSTPTTTPNVNGASHSYGKDGNYNLSIVTIYSITPQNGSTTPVEKVAPACTFPIAVSTPTTPTTTPGSQEVCELSTGKVVAIPEGSYDTTVYGPTSAAQCNPTVTVTSASADSSGPTLVNTGPGAILVIFGLAIVGGYVFHHGHRHLKTKKHHRHAAK